jgi:hypothetical protein
MSISALAAMKASRAFDRFFEPVAEPVSPFGWALRRFMAGFLGCVASSPCDQTRSVAPSNQLNTKRYHQLDRIFRAMKGMSEREYAAHSGLSRGGVQKARKNGRLVVHDDGSINAAASDVRRAEMTDPDQQRRSLGGDGLASGPGDTTSYIKARTALTVYAAQERQLAVQKKKGTLVDRARAETLVFRLARQERDVWVTWPGRVAALMAAQIMAEVERQSGASVTIETAIMQRVLEAHVREQLDALADLRVSLG